MKLTFKARCPDCGKTEAYELNTRMHWKYRHGDTDPWQRVGWGDIPPEITNQLAQMDANSFEPAPGPDGEPVFKTRQPRH